MIKKRNISYLISVLQLRSWKPVRNLYPIRVHSTSFTNTFFFLFFQPLVKYGILAPLVAQIGKDADVAEFLNAGYSIVQNDEPGTIQWFAVKYDTVAPNSTFAIFDTFTSEAGRQAHLNGQVPVALSANAARLLVPDPVDIRQVEVLASKVEKVTSDKKAGLSVGLRVLIEAKPEKVQTVRQFLTVSVSIIAMF